MMVRLLKQMMSSEKGQALPIVLALMVFGALVITPSLGYISTSLNSSRVIRDDVKGIYAADAGVEDILWSLDNGMFFPDKHLPEFINQMMVDTQTEETGTYTLYFGEMIEPGGHSDYLGIDGEMVWDDGAQAYKYTITVTWQPTSGDPVVHLDEVGARLPQEFSYQAGSAANFTGNLSTDEPDETLDSVGACMLNWVFDNPLPVVTENKTVATQIFYITGDGESERDYAWVVPNRVDIGPLGEITGTSYQITATARRYEYEDDVAGETTAKIVANVIVEEETEYILSWQILN
jgi:hypothetical protein